MQAIKSIRNIMLLIALIGAVVFSWLAGHIMRHYIPELQQPREVLPGEKIVMFEAYSPQIMGGVPITNWTVSSIWQGCKNNVYYTSLPAKCRSMNGSLVRVRKNQREYLVVPMLELEK